MRVRVTADLDITEGKWQQHLAHWRSRSPDLRYTNIGELLDHDDLVNLIDDLQVHLGDCIIDVVISG